MAYKNARKIKFDAKHRVETGAVRFNDDWNGLFVRGDDCIMFSYILRKMLDDSICRFLLDPADAGFVAMLLEEIDENVLMKPEKQEPQN